MADVNEAEPNVMVRPDVEGFLAFLNGLPGPKLHELDPEPARQTMVQMTPIAELDAPQMAEKRAIALRGAAGTIPGRLYRPRADMGPGPLVVFYHGGGFVIGDLDTHDAFCAEVARALDLPLVAVDYRLAPEAPFPAAPDDCEAATRWLAEGPEDLGFEPSGLVLMGDSAGGNLAIVTAMALRDRPASAPVLVLAPIYPAVDGGVDWPSMAEHADGKLLTADAMRWFMEHYQPTEGDPRAHPLAHDQTGMPATAVITAGLDPLRDQGRAYAAALVKAAVPTIFMEATGNIHGFVCLRKAIPSSQRDVEHYLRAVKLLLDRAR